MAKLKYPPIEVPKADFDALLGKLLKAEPLPKAAIPKKALRQRSDRPKNPPQPESSDP
jgi:hypothetical protein